MVASNPNNSRMKALLSRPARVARHGLLRLRHARAATRILRCVCKRSRASTGRRVPLRLRLAVRMLPLTIWVRERRAGREQRPLGLLRLDAKAVRRAYDAACRTSDVTFENTFLKSARSAPLAMACVATAFKRTLGIALTEPEAVTLGRFGSAARAVREFTEFTELNRYPDAPIALETERRVFCRAVEVRDEMWRRAAVISATVANRRDRALRRRLTALHRPRLRRLRRQAALLAGLDSGDGGITIRLVVMQESLALLSRLDAAFSREDFRQCAQHFDDGHRDLIALVTRNLDQGANT